MVVACANSPESESDQFTDCPCSRVQWLVLTAWAAHVATARPSSHQHGSSSQVLAIQVISIPLLHGPSSPPPRLTLLRTIPSLLWAPFKIKSYREFIDKVFLSRTCVIAHKVHDDSKLAAGFSFQECHRRWENISSSQLVPVFHIYRTPACSNFR